VKDLDFNLGPTGFDDEELARLLATQDAAEGFTDEDAIPELPKTPISVAGDLWILGNHILVVGDATDGAAGQAEAQMEVKYVVYWKQEGGRWKWHVDIWNQNS